MYFGISSQSKVAKYPQLASVTTVNDLPPNSITERYNHGIAVSSAGKACSIFAGACKRGKNMLT
jgi:hypothetical protein